MSTAVSSTPGQPPPRPIFDPFAAFLSYLVPGLGQLYQGRIGKGLLFLVCLYGMFFYGMHLGHWKNVYLPDVARHQPGETRLPFVVKNVWERLQFAGQFWIGVAAWPAIMQYNNISVPFNKDFQKAPDEREINDLQRDSDKTWDLGWICTVIAGVLNVLVIYDALAGPAFVHMRAGSTSSAAEKPLKEVVA